ncbi:uncharacterized protein LOC111601817 isoform X2 [Drosophila hydei]|uniref:Uncharacterized protein LOC111601817 isoform X2 n=1 Tax=Drosophila hydei TaxID=7224 RepID=A0A6J1M7N1_DROHY|nr:uncharacterized protein LOC111601817 isoform X2 [Drosophila hydei]
MDIGNEMHQQFIKDFIQSLQVGSEEGSCCMKSNSRSLSESSLNPNAAEFVPSYMKSSDAEDDEEAEPQYHRQEPKASASSTTTLVNNILDGDSLHMNKDETLGRIQRQLFNLMNQLGNQNMPVLQIQFSLTTNGQGICVQFLAPEGNKRQYLDKHLCQTACLRLEVNENGSQSNRPGFTLARQFLIRMGDALNDKTQENSLSVCPKCTALTKKHSFTEMEIDRQIEDIKAFETLINEDAGARYQEAFKQLCQKLGLNKNDDQPTEIGPAAVVVPQAVNQTKNDVSENIELPFHEDDLSSYEWDPFMPEFTTMKVYRYPTPNTPELRVTEKKVPKEELAVKADYELKTPMLPRRACSTPGNASSAYPKLYKVNNHVKWSSSPGVRKVITHKDKESKIQRWRYSSPVVVATPSGTSASAAITTAPAATTVTVTSASASAAAGGTTTTTAAAPASTSAAPASKSAAPASTSAATGLAAKKTSEQAHQNGNRIKRAYQFTVHPKSGSVSNASSEVASKTTAKIESRSQLATAKQQGAHAHISHKLNKADTLNRTSGVGQAQGTKHSTTAAAQRIVVPRSTHASQMRQSEVKRRLNLMRGDNDTDVQFNEYLFK